MPKIIIELPEDRTRAGLLRLVSDEGKDVTVPFSACGKADGKTAKAKGNPSRDPVKPYGDTPCGDFDVVDILKTGKSSEYESSLYGSSGTIRLKPRQGQAALAARSGRTGLMIHGGDRASDGGLKPTNGSIRLSNEDMGRLLQAIALLSINDAPPDVCIIKRADKAMAARVGPDEGYDQSDPPGGMVGDWSSVIAMASRMRTRQDEATQYGDDATDSNQPQPDRDAQERNQGKDYEKHDRETHNRETTTRDSHDREPSHDREAHDRGHDRLSSSI